MKQNLYTYTNTNNSDIQKSIGISSLSDSLIRYRFGFNSKENVDEVYGITGSFQDYGMRDYNSRLARFIKNYGAGAGASEGSPSMINGGSK